MCFHTLRYISWWISVNVIVLIVSHSLHSENILIWPNKNFVYSSLHSNIVFHLPSRFCLDAFECRCCHWFFPGFSPKSSFTVLFSDLSEISNYFAIFHIHPCGLHALLDGATDSPEWFLPVTGFGKIVYSSWIFFLYLKNSLFANIQLFYHLTILYTRYAAIGSYSVWTKTFTKLSLAIDMENHSSPLSDLLSG